MVRLSHCRAFNYFCLGRLFLYKIPGIVFVLVKALLCLLFVNLDNLIKKWDDAPCYSGGFFKPIFFEAIPSL